MRLLRRLCMLAAFAAAVALAAPGMARAEDWPTRPITMIVPFPAGGSADAVARLVAMEKRDKL